MRRLVVPQHAKKVPHQANLIIYRSLDPDSSAEDWEPVLPADVPAFLKRQDVVKQLVDGQCCQFKSKSEYWYRAEKAEVH